MNRPNIWMNTQMDRWTDRQTDRQRGQTDNKKAKNWMDEQTTELEMTGQVYIKQEE